jgi:peptidoglycan/LPS O-acetylase OafA/YrhL
MSRDVRLRGPVLDALTGLRFFVALHVLVFHVFPWASWRARGVGSASLSPLLSAVAGCGHVAVSLFFILSGFILTYVHSDSVRGRAARYSFYVGRFARIYPTYLIGLALIAPFYFVHTARTEGVAQLAKGASAVLLLVQAYVPSLALVWNPPAWSLSDEALFYALFPPLALLLVPCRRSTAIAAGLLAYAFCLALPLAYLAFRPDGAVETSSASSGFWIDVLRYDPLVRFPEFVIGIVLGRLYLDDRVRRLLDASAAALSMAAALALILVFSRSFAIPYPLLHNGLLAPLFALLVLSLAVGRGPLAAVLSTRPIVALGDASYALYILHVPLIVYWAKVTRFAFAGRPLRPATSVFLDCAFVVVAVAASLICHRYAELPLRDRVRATWSGYRSSVPSDSTRTSTSSVSPPPPT